MGKRFYGYGYLWWDGFGQSGHAVNGGPQGLEGGPVTGGPHHENTAAHDVVVFTEPVIVPFEGFPVLFLAQFGPPADVATTGMHGLGQATFGDNGHVFVAILLAHFPHEAAVFEAKPHAFVAVL